MVTARRGFDRVRHAYENEEKREEEKLLGPSEVSVCRQRSRATGVVGMLDQRGDHLTRQKACRTESWRRGMVGRRREAVIGGIKELDMQVCYPPPLLRLPAARPYNLSSSSPSPSFFPSLNPHTAVSFFLPPLSFPFLPPFTFV